MRRPGPLKTAALGVLAIIIIAVGWAGICVSPPGRPVRRGSPFGLPAALIPDVPVSAAALNRAVARQVGTLGLQRRLYDRAQA